MPRLAARLPLVQAKSIRFGVTKPASWPREAQRSSREPSFLCTFARAKMFGHKARLAPRANKCPLGSLAAAAATRQLCDPAKRRAAGRASEQRVPLTSSHQVLLPFIASEKGARFPIFAPASHANKCSRARHKWSVACLPACLLARVLVGWRSECVAVPTFAWCP